jgi:hypothetical protein
MRDVIIMNKKELERIPILESHACGKLTLNDCAIRMHVSYRQAKRIWKRYKASKAKGLIHRNRGRKPAIAYSNEFKETILSIYRTKYLEFGPTFAAEKLFEDDDISINAETLRLWLKNEGLWTKKRKHKIYRERRERRPCFGDLLQIDGSIHKWFSNTDEHYCLLNIVDDSTGITMAFLDKGETTKILLKTLKKWIETYGIPKAVYVDLKSVYVGFKKLKEKYDDDLLIQEGFSVFEQVCKKLNIQIIRAYSAQAKGRVERKHGVFQDRLVKDLKLYGINTIEVANNYLEERFLPKINQKFAIDPASKIDAHRSIDLYEDLNEILCWNYKRNLRNDWTIQFERQYYQLEKIDSDLKPGEIISIKRYLNGQMRFWYKGKELKYRKLPRKPIPPSELKSYYTPKGPCDPKLLSIRAKQNKHKSPWSRTPTGWLSPKKHAEKEKERLEEAKQLDQLSNF